MPEENGASSQADVADESQADQDGASTTDQASKAESADELPEWARKLIKDTRKENAAFRTKLRSLEDRGKDEGKDKPDDLTALRTEIESLRTERRREHIERQVIESAERAGAMKPMRVLRMYRDDLDIDDDGSITNLPDVIAQAKDDEPGWFARRSVGSADGGAGGNRAENTNDMNRLIRRQAGFGP